MKPDSGSEREANAPSPVRFAALMPHAPILVPPVGGVRTNEAAATVRAMEEVGRRLAANAPEAVVVISPHAPRSGRRFAILSGERLEGSLIEFDAPEAEADLPNDEPLAAAIADEARTRHIETWRPDYRRLDYGALVPLWHLVSQGWHGPTVVLGLNYPGEGGHTELGEAIAAAARRLGQFIAVIASGDMSHRLKPGAPSGFHPRAQAFDFALIDLLKRGAYREVPKVDAELQELAGEDVMDSTTAALAAVNWNASGHEVLGYEGPFGVGYGVAILHDTRPPASDPLAVGEHRQAILSDGGGEHLPQIARRAVEAALRSDGESAPNFTGGYLASRRGVFVTLRHRSGDLRGCVGTLTPKRRDVVEETWHVAREAAFSDIRFPPVKGHELRELAFEISVLHALEPVASEEELDPCLFGVVVRAAGGRQGALLPGIDEIDSVAHQLRIAREKAGIRPGEPVAIERFRVDKFRERATSI
ncbi:MAG TPA: AmmeMemoRadiSam system protein A [Verrucomicrobiae bacterium]|jgi:AmmeMemoRadiSam system protein A